MSISGPDYTTPIIIVIGIGIDIGIGIGTGIGIVIGTGIGIYVVVFIYRLTPTMVVLTTGMSISGPDCTIDPYHHRRSVFHSSFSTGSSNAS